MRSEGSRVDAVLLGLDWFRVLEAREIDGEVELVVETIAEVGWCRSCGVRAHSKGRPVVLVRDIDAFGQPVRLRWVKRNGPAATSTRDGPRPPCKR